MGYFNKAFVLNVFRVFQLPCNVEGDVDCRSSDVEGWCNVALQRVTDHQQVFG